MDKLKQALLFILAVVTGAFFYERSRRKSAEAIADNKEVLDELNKGDKQKALNDGKLESEEAKREEIKQQSESDKRDNSGDVAEFFRKR
jgi:hypothetical protein